MKKKILIFFQFLNIFLTFLLLLKNIEVFYSLLFVFIRNVNIL